VSEEQIHFLELFLIFCLLNDSPRITASEGKAIDHNQILAAHRGREPGLALHCGERAVPLKERARELLAMMLPLAGVLDGADPQRPYSRVLERQRETVADPQMTPSALMLARMREEGLGYPDFAERMSRAHHDYFDALTLPAERRSFFLREAADSHQRQLELEASDDRPFERFLDDYFAQRE
jgi:glutamate--cysteine ligase